MCTEPKTDPISPNLQDARTSGEAELPYARPCLDESDIEAVVGVLRGAYLTTGPMVVAFEAALAGTVGAAETVAVANGTAALHLATVTLGLKPGDAVVVPAVTFMATANAARYVGADVLFADVDPETGLMGPEHVERALNRAGSLTPRAVFPVHLNGQAAEMDGLRTLCNQFDLSLVVDGCHALGTTYSRHEGEGRVGDGVDALMTIFSFHAVKVVAMGEGGALTTNDPELARRLRRLRDHGIQRDPHEFIDSSLAYAADGDANPWYHELSELGFNYRLSDIQCALGLSQLSKLDRFMARRSALVTKYDARLARFAPAVRPISRAPGQQPSWHLYPVLIDFVGLGVSRAAAMNALRLRGVGTQVHYIPVPWQPYYRARYGAFDLPGAQAYYGRVLSLPLFPSMTDEDVERVVTDLAEVLSLSP
jgi:UDP-4-amino-4,6-dideoxy-N-acetyl-beta-L-altrosamine transaminase